MRVLLSGGGTGGHIYPALAIAQACRKEAEFTEFLYVGSERGLESQIVPRAELPFETIEISGFRRRIFTLEHFRTITRFWKGVRRARKLIRRFKPDVVVGTGGFVCGPVVYAATRLGVPTLIHEQNVIPGITNKFLSKFVDSIAVSFDGSERHFKSKGKVFYSGNPCGSNAVAANAMAGLRSLGLIESSRIVLITGGSRGAKALNEAVKDMLPVMIEDRSTAWIWVTGNIYFDEYEQAVKPVLGANGADHIRVLPYLNNMPDVLAASKLVISRAGASFIAETTALGIPSILIPSPNVTNNHQEANARWVQNGGAAEVILEDQLTGERLYQMVNRIMNDEMLRRRMSDSARSLGKTDAASVIVEQMVRLAGRSSHSGMS